MYKNNDENAAERATAATSTSSHSAAGAPSTASRPDEELGHNGHPDDPLGRARVKADEGRADAEEGEDGSSFSAADEAADDDDEEAGRLSHRFSATIARVASSVGSLDRQYSQDRKHGPPGHIAGAPIPLSDLDKGVVGWDSQDDPAMPLNFSRRRKWLMIGFLAGMTFMTPFASSILAPAITFMDADFHVESETVGSLTVSIYLLGYAVGPLLLAGMSEQYGRHIVLTASNAFFCAWQIGCALAPSIGSLIAFRVLAGIGGSACMSLGGALIGDMFHVHERGIALAVWSLGPLIGPSIGPIAGAWIAQTIGWRWDFWITLIPGAINAAVIAVFSAETSHHVLIRRKVKRLSRELGRTDLRSCYDDPDKPPVRPRDALLQGLVRPLKMLLMSPILLIISIYSAFAYGLLYLLFNTIPMVFQEGYGWSIGITGLVYIPLGIGYCFGLAAFAYLSDRTVVRLTKKNNGVFEPEMRLVDCVYFTCCLPITFFWYGWAADKRVHWIVPVLGLFPYGFAILGVWQPSQAFVIDAFGHYSASALAAFTVLRSNIAAFLPLAGPGMYAALGVGWGNSLLGFICVALIPVPLLIYRYGRALRKRFPVSL
ncbi:major facilitator superfamily transporter multidrug resistance [Niveomyces insectorum RCEF 264]|uniref:Major facilitator superfamily transporter multidrug resistance n=1 Tax=Niveomyces insectorum RCEF 264 TaxID=1081102 RepID=A0A162LBX1_9HYPO|nr:major facilitator superfamily transporter multidrug resistance [Niveomyces insectorum RCEF 264]